MTQSTNNQEKVNVLKDVAKVVNRINGSLDKLVYHKMENKNDFVTSDLDTKELNENDDYFKVIKNKVVSITSDEYENLVLSNVGELFFKWRETLSSKTLSIYNRAELSTLLRKLYK